MEIENEPVLQVLWTRDALLKHKEFPLEKKEQAFNWYWRINGDQIVLRLPSKAPTSFSESDVPKEIQLNPTKEGYREVFEQWLKEKVSMQGMEIEEPEKDFLKRIELEVKNLGNQCWTTFTKFEKERFYVRFLGVEKAEKLERSLKKACGDIEETRWLF